MCSEKRYCDELGGPVGEREIGKGFVMTGSVNVIFTVDEEIVS